MPKKIGDFWRFQNLNLFQVLLVVSSKGFFQDRLCFVSIKNQFFIFIKYTVDQK